MGPGLRSIALGEASSPVAAARLSTMPQPPLPTARGLWTVPHVVVPDVLSPDEHQRLLDFALAHRDENAALLGELDGVADQVAEQALQEVRIGEHGEVAQRKGELEAKPLLDGERAELGIDAREQAVDHDRFGRRFDPPGVELRDVEQGVEQVAQRGEGNRQVMDHARLRFVERGRLQRAVEEVDRLQGLPEVVARRREEIALRPVEAVCFLLREAQFAR